MAARQSRHKPRTENLAQGELALLEVIRRRAAAVGSRDVRLGIGDDCALLRVRPAEELAVTTDLSISGRHFRLDWHPPESVGHRALARGLSDLAAMGARPVAAFLSLGVPAELIKKRGKDGPLGKPAPSWVDRFYAGLFGLADRYRIPLAGGDLAQSPIALADIVLTGAVPAGKAMLRSGARAGDGIYVTGQLGGAAAGLAGLAAWAGPASEEPLRRLIPKRLAAALAPHLFPEPKIKQGLWLRNRSAATAALDISDGLSTDLGHLCEESGVGAVIEADRLPIADGASLEQALHGGEDYELLFTAGPGARLPRRIAGVPITRIGTVLRRRSGQPPIVLAEASGERPLERAGWEHFTGSKRPSPR